MLACRYLERDWRPANRIGVEGAQALAAALAQTQLTHMDLACMLLDCLSTMQQAMRETDGYLTLMHTRA